MKRFGIIAGLAALLALTGSGCTLWWLPEGDPPEGTIVDNTPPAEYSLPGAVNRMATALIVKASQNDCSSVPVGVRGDLIVLPVWTQAAQMLNWKRGETDSEWQLESIREKNTWQVRLLRNNEPVWQDKVILREGK